MTAGGKSTKKKVRRQRDRDHRWRSYPELSKSVRPRNHFGVALCRVNEVLSSPTTLCTPTFRLAFCEHHHWLQPPVLLLHCSPLWSRRPWTKAEEDELCTIFQSPSFHKCCAHSHKFAAQSLARPVCVLPASWLSALIVQAESTHSWGLESGDSDSDSDCRCWVV